MSIRIYCYLDYPVKPDNDITPASVILGPFFSVILGLAPSIQVIIKPYLILIPFYLDYPVKPDNDTREEVSIRIMTSEKKCQT